METEEQLLNGVRHYQAHRYADSECAALTVLRADAQNFRAMNLLGMSLFQQGRLDEGRRHVAAATEIAPDYAAAHNNLAAIHQAQGDLESALHCVKRAIGADPGCADFYQHQGLLLLEAAQREPAAASFRRSIELDPSLAAAHAGLGDALAQSGRWADALPCYAQALALEPARVEVLNNRGNALFRLGRLADALEDFDRAVALQPDFCEVLSNRGNALRELKRYDEALASLRRALELRPDSVDALNNLGNVFRALKQPADALASYEQALSIKPDNAEALNNRGIALVDLKRLDAALESYNRALALRPGYPEALNNRGIVYGELKQPERALEDFDAALAARPDYAEAWSNRGNALRDLARPEDAVASFERAVTLKPDFADAYYSLGHAQRDLRRYSASVQSYARVVEVAPEFEFARGHLLHAKMLCCEWAGLHELAARVKQDVAAGARSAEPFGYQAIADSPRDLRRCAELFADAMYPPRQTAAPAAPRSRGDKIRIGYLSGEFRQQATSVLMTQLFELHDKSRFEIVAFDNGWDDRSGIRRRLEAAFDEIVDISHSSDEAAANLIRERNIDILVNLNGYFGLHRLGVFGARPCPLQVNYLGFPGTIGAPYIDYIVADQWVIPPEEQGEYSEKVVYLPDSYQVNDARRPIAATVPSRAELELPARGFVFCCFNNNYKITPEIFGIWMRLLKQVDGSVLWLLSDNADAVRNLRLEAEKSGIAATRLVFAPRLAPAEHLARHRLADLFLDTLPYNAHTTASDALWAGLPVLTCAGSTFPGRVAASLLHAVGMPDLITRDLQEYEQRALQLAGDPVALERLRSTLAQNRDNCALFDTQRFCRNIEAAYTTMWQRHREGKAPAGFAVTVR